MTSNSISVIIPAYNAEKTIWRALKSIENQTLLPNEVIVVDDDVNIREWDDVIWAITTRMDPARDTVLIENTPIDYLDFASPVSGLGSKMGMDATHKWEGETDREWGRTIQMDAATRSRIDLLWDSLNIHLPGQSKE